MYPKASVFENVYRGALCHFDVPVWAQIAQTSAYKAARERIRSEVERVLDITGLAPYRNEIAGELAYGHQKRIGVAIGLATHPPYSPRTAPHFRDTPLANRRVEAARRWSFCGGGHVGRFT